jgi:HSP20 family protein
MKLPSLWSGSSELAGDPFRSLRRDMDEMFQNIGRRWPSVDIGAGAPPMSVAETKDAVEVSAELPGVDEKDIKVSIEDNRLIIAGEKKQDSKREDKDWHVEERSFGSFYRALALPFRPADDAVDAHFDKGILKLTIRKPPEQKPTAKSIEIKTGTPPATA